MPIYLWLSPVMGITLFFIGKFVIKAIKQTEATHSYFTDFNSGQVPSVGTSDNKSLVHRWDPKIKMASGIIFSFFSVSLSSPVLLSIPLAWVLLFSIIARIPLNSTIRRLKPVITFSVILVILLPLTAPSTQGSRFIILEPFTGWLINYDALTKALTIALKAMTVVIMTTLILETSPYTVTVSSLQKIGIPASFSQMLLLTYRYIFVLIDEAGRMHKAMRLRGFTPKTDLETLKITGQFIGTLFVRSFERVQRITEAMKLRGYKGRFPDFYHCKARPKDWGLGILWIGISAGSYMAQIFLSR